MPGMPEDGVAERSEMRLGNKDKETEEQEDIWAFAMVEA